MITTRYLAALLLLVASSANAEWYGVLNLASAHAVAKKPMNERNPGLGVEYADGDVTYMAGVYRNSHSRTSVYGLVSYKPVSIGNFRIGAAAGAASGYPGRNGARTLGVVAGLVQWRYERVGLNVLTIPKTKNADMIVGLQAVYKF